MFSTLVWDGVAMFQRPVFKPHLHVQNVPGEGIFVLSGTQHTVLRGWLYELVVPQLDGCPVEQVYQQLSAYASVAQIHYTLRKLDEQGLLCEAAQSIDARQAAFWTNQHLDPDTTTRRLAETPVALEAYGVDPQPLVSLLGACGVRVDAHGALRVVVVDHYLRRELEAYNRQALESGHPWMLVKPVGGLIWVGPVFRSGASGCWECLARRIRANNPVLGYLDTLRDEQRPLNLDPGQTPATESVGWGLAAGAITAWIAHGGQHPLLEGRIQTLDLVNFSAQSHTVIRQPACPACGSGLAPPEELPPPVVLQSRKKIYTEDGGHRVLSPQETLDNYAHHVSPISGTVTGLDRTGPDGDGVMHVYISGANSARKWRSFDNVRWDLRSATAGKGTSDVQAKAGALCEAMERYSGVFQGNERRRTARLVDLGDEGIPPNACMLFSEKQFCEREVRNQSSVGYHHIPVPFDPERPIEWTPVWSLTRQTVRWLPTAFCYFDYPTDPDFDFCLPCSNGNAAGNCLEEAILQGFFELAERDAVGVWWYNRLRVPAVDLDTLDDPYVHRLKAYLASRGRDLWVLDVTTDLGIPAFTAVSRRIDDPREEIMLGFGAHAEAKIGLLRAVTELNQMLVPLLQPQRDPQRPLFGDPATVDWIENATLAAHPYLVPSDSPLRRLDRFPRDWTDDLRDDIELGRRRVEDAGLEMLVLEQTRPETGMPVVKVIVPGLRHFWARFGAGRLYDVPVRMGVLPRPLAEEQLNPVPMFL
jgi:ribosomal protein S12 methylthiotransferase accessory factor